MATPKLAPIVEQKTVEAIAAAMRERNEQKRDYLKRTLAELRTFAERTEAARVGVRDQA